MRQSILPSALSVLCFALALIASPPARARSTPEGLTFQKPPIKLDGFIHQEPPEARDFDAKTAFKILAKKLLAAVFSWMRVPETEPTVERGRAYFEPILKPADEPEIERLLQRLHPDDRARFQREIERLKQRVPCEVAPDEKPVVRLQPFMFQDPPEARDPEQRFLLGFLKKQLISFVFNWLNNRNVRPNIENGRAVFEPVLTETDEQALNLTVVKLPAEDRAAFQSQIRQLRQPIPFEPPSPGRPEVKLEEFLYHDPPGERSDEMKTVFKLVANKLMTLVFNWLHSRGPEAIISEAEERQLDRLMQPLHPDDRILFERQIARLKALGNRTAGKR